MLKYKETYICVPSHKMSCGWHGPRTQNAHSYTLTRNYYCSHRWLLLAMHDMLLRKSKPTTTSLIFYIHPKCLNPSKSLPLQDPRPTSQWIKRLQNFPYLPFSMRVIICAQSHTYRANPTINDSRWVIIPNGCRRGVMDKEEEDLCKIMFIFTQFGCALTWSREYPKWRKYSRTIKIAIACEIMLYTTIGKQRWQWRYRMENPVLVSNGKYCTTICIIIVHKCGVDMDLYCYFFVESEFA